MSTRIKDSERTKLIADFIKTGAQPDGWIITETNNGGYRVRKAKSEREQLQDKRAKLIKQLEEVEAKLNASDHTDDHTDE